ncbi:MAG: hypothetical protein KDC93_14305 [Cyclobacteriaceae bacterium]|jgi:hypothetical protein|nr:hypothetical protein [Cyclobacteriaceae bacterium]
MSIQSNIVHQYFKKEIEGSKLLVKLNPIHLNGIELVVYAHGEVEVRELDFDEAIFEDLEADGFKEVSGMEFNLHLSGLAK